MLNFGPFYIGVFSDNFPEWDVIIIMADFFWVWSDP